MSSQDIFIPNPALPINRSNYSWCNAGCTEISQYRFPLDTELSGCPDYSGLWDPCNGQNCGAPINLSGIEVSGINFDTSGIIAAISGLEMTVSGQTPNKEIEVVTLCLTDGSTVPGFACLDVVTGDITLVLGDGTTAAPVGAQVYTATNEGFTMDTC